MRPRSWQPAALTRHAGRPGGPATVYPGGARCPWPAATQRGPWLACGQLSKLGLLRPLRLWGVQRSLRTQRSDTHRMASPAAGGPQLPSRRQQLYCTAVYATAHLCIGLTVGIKGPALLKLAEQSQGIDASRGPANATDAGLAAVGASNAAASFGLMVGALAGGILIDRVSKWHRLFAANWLCCAVFFAGFALCSTVGGLVAVSALHGLTIGVFQPCFNIRTLRTWAPEHVGPYTLLTICMLHIHTNVCVCVCVCDCVCVSLTLCLSVSPYTVCSTEQLYAVRTQHLRPRNVPGPARSRSRA